MNQLRSGFEDLQGIRSFGFRGEALSSLCDVAGGFSVCTRCETEAVGSLLTYRRNGELESQKAKPRPIGTSVTVTKLFNVRMLGISSH